jgi:hypothetical protein
MTGLHHVRAAASDSPEAGEWDAYLAGCPRGQFQQASGWATLKRRDGWSCARVFVGLGTPYTGGFQLLWKPSRFGRIGYVSKGPVLAEESADTVDRGLQQLCGTGAALGLRALIVQPPDDSQIPNSAFDEHAFSSFAVPGVIGATAIVDLRAGPEAILKHMRKSARQQWRQAGRRGVTLRWGSREDASLFFRLMSTTCRRQNTAPNPSRAELVDALWDGFPGKIHLAFAEYEGRSVAGVLMITLGTRITFWKKGWDSEDPRLFANCFLMTECLLWATGQRYETADFAGMSMDVATARLAGAELSEEQEHSRDLFHLRLGATPRLLPPARLLVLSPALRSLVDLGLGYEPIRSSLFHRIGLGA